VEDNLNTENKPFKDKPRQQLGFLTIVKLQF